MPTSNDPDAELSRCMELLRLKTQSHIDAWGLGGTERWDVDLDTGVISFSSPGLLVTAPVQIVGSHDPGDGFWLWAWHNPTVPQRLAQDSLRVRDFGERFWMSRCTTGETRCTEDEAWRYTALACDLAGASGAYRGAAGDTNLFMTFHQVTIERSG